MKIRDVLKENLRSARIMWIIRKLCSYQGFLPGPTRASGKPDAETVSSWSYDMEGHAKQCVERYCELANKTTQQLYKVVTPCMDDHQFKEEENESVGELSTVCSQIVLNSCIWLVLGDLIFCGL